MRYVFCLFNHFKSFKNSNSLLHSSKSFLDKQSSQILSMQFRISLTSSLNIRSKAISNFMVKSLPLTSFLVFIPSPPIQPAYLEISYYSPFLSFSVSFGCPVTNQWDAPFPTELDKVGRPKQEFPKLVFKIYFFSCEVGTFWKPCYAYPCRNFKFSHFAIHTEHFFSLLHCEVFCFNHTSNPHL